MSTLTIPNSFTANTVADPTQVNQNFNTIATFINGASIDNSNIKAGSITSTNLAVGAVAATNIGTSCYDGSTVTINGSGALEVASGGITLSQLASAVAQALTPAGTIIAFGSSSGPSGYIYCDGSAVSRSTYSALFGVLGVSWGSGDGVSTFNLPDLRGYFLRGTDDGTGRDPDSGSRTACNSGGNTGDSVGSVQSDQFASHSHSYTVPNALGSGSIVDVGGPSAFQGGYTTGNTGGDETRPKNAYVRFYVKT